MPIPPESALTDEVVKVTYIKLLEQVLYRGTIRYAGTTQGQSLPRLVYSFFFQTFLFSESLEIPTDVIWSLVESKIRKTAELEGSPSREKGVNIRTHKTETVRKLTSSERIFKRNFRTFRRRIVRTPSYR